MEKLGINGGIWYVIFRLAIPKYLAFIIRVLWRKRQTSVEYANSLLFLPDGELIYVLLPQELIANSAAFPPNVVKYLFNALVVAYIKVLGGQGVHL